MNVFAEPSARSVKASTATSGAAASGLACSSAAEDGGVDGAVDGVFENADAMRALRLCARIAATPSLAELRVLVRRELPSFLRCERCELALNAAWNFDSDAQDASTDAHFVCNARQESSDVELRVNDECVGFVRVEGAQANIAPTPLLNAILEALGATSERLRLIEQLEGIKREWRAMLDGMVDGVYVCDGNGTISRANRTFALMIDRQVTSVVGQSRDELWSALPEFEVLTPWHQVAGESELVTFSRELRFGQTEQTVLETAFELAPERVALLGLSEDHKTRYLCVVRDTTESRRWQEQLIQSEKLAALGELTSGVAHELNNPLATIVGYAELVARDSELPPRVQRKIDTMHGEAVRASHIVQNLLAYARRSSSDKQFVSLNDVVGAVVEMRSYQLSTDDVRLNIDLDAHLPAVWGDAMQLQQVVLNVVNNAVQALITWRGSGEVRLSTHTVAFGGRAGARLIIEDNGPGIVPDHLRRIFDPFFTTKPPGEGTGLGMSISQRIISNHEGLIWAESRVGHGARFIIELPGAGDGQDSPPPSEIPAALEAESPREGAQVLVVDDEEPVVMLLSEIMALDGHHVTGAFNGAEAIALLKAQDFDLILSDVRMPAVGGPTFFEILQTTRPDLLERVIFVTGDTMSASTQEFLKRAARPVVAKPFDPEDLREIVRATLR